MKRTPKSPSFARHIKPKKPLVSRSLRLNSDHCERVEALGINLASWVRELMDRAMKDLDSGK